MGKNGGSRGRPVPRKNSKEGSQKQSKMYVRALVVTLIAVLCLATSNMLQSSHDLVEGPEERVARLSKFFSWLLDNGFRATPGAIKVKWMNDEVGFGVVALREVEEGETLFCLPNDLMWKPKNARTWAKWGQILSYISERATDRHSLPVFALMLENSDPFSFWRPYFDSLPPPSSPYYYTEDELNALQNEFVVSNKDFVMDGTLEDYDTLMPELRDKFSSELRDGSRYTREHFAWAVHVIAQRAFDSDPDGTALIPYLDLLNSEMRWSPEENTVLSLNDYDWGSQELCVRAYNSYSAGEEIHNTYHPHYNSVEYLLQYGYVTDDNINDSIMLQVVIPESDPLYRARFHAIGINNPDSEVMAEAVLRFPNASIPLAFAQAVEVASMESEEELKSLNHIKMKDWLLRSVPRIGAAIRHHLEHAFPTTMEQDSLMLENPMLNLTYATRTAISFRRLVKRRLQEMANIISDRPLRVVKQQDLVGLPLVIITIRPQDPYLKTVETKSDVQ